jgi:hypothetical protein
MEGGRWPRGKEATNPDYKPLTATSLWLGKHDCTIFGSILTVYPSEAVLHINVLKGHTTDSSPSLVFKEKQNVGSKLNQE